MKNIDSINHVKGKSIYLDDIATQKGTLYGVVFTSKQAHAEIIAVDYSEALKLEGVETIIDYKAVHGDNQIGGIIEDEPLFAENIVDYIGQPIALVLAKTEKIARKALKKIKCDYKPKTIVVDVKEAHEKQLYLMPPRTFSYGDIDNIWNKCDYVFEGEAETGAQEHLYIETQGCYAYPIDNGSIKIHSSTQSPTAVQKTCAKVLGISMNKIEVDVARLGGAFGGKEDQATGIAVMAALAVSILQKPVKIVLHRMEDMQMTGKRHPYVSTFKIGLTKDLKIMAYEAVMLQNGGASSDLSPAIMERSLFHSTNSYFIPNTKVTVYSCRTNLPPNTAFRGFGAPQGAFVIEAAIANAAKELNVEPRAIQEKNFLQENDEFQYGQIAKQVNIQKTYLELNEKFNIEREIDIIKEFNRNNFAKKQGYSIIPICFGISFTKTSLNQARALVHVYQDGSVGISTGAIEMGQGVNTKLIQIAAYEFGIDVKRIKIESTNTTRVANTSPTAASTGADLNGNALRIACRNLKLRLIEKSAEILKTTIENVEIKDETVCCKQKPTDLTWDKLITNAYLDRINLTENGHYATPTIYFDKNKEKGHPFAYHVYGSAFIVAEIDCVTGIYTIQKALVVHDFGNSMNSVLDNGQLEGAIVQGIGWMTMEEIIFNSQGKLTTPSLTTYKIPDIYSVPKIIKIEALKAEGPELAVLKSKAIGEPPFLYGIGAYFAIENAVLEFNKDYKPKYDAPFTPEKVLKALYNK